MSVGPEELRASLADLSTLEREILRREALLNPVAFGLPDLLFPMNEQPLDTRGFSAEELPEVIGSIKREPLDYKETLEEYEERQNAALRDFIQSRFWVTKDGRRIPVIVLDEMERFLGDLFFMRVTRAILWKPRGGGGSLLAAVLIWLFLVYRNMSVTDVAGGEDQSKIVYRYVVGFWDLFPDLKRNILAKTPLISTTVLKTGVQLNCIPATERKARGIHVPVLVVDEAAQQDPSVNRSMKSALSTVSSEEISVVVLLSTFHLPTGVFQEYWDEAAEKGFTQYRWNVFDTMKPCEEGLENATHEDPRALSHCEMCFLTNHVEIKNEMGKVVEVRPTGCNGKARDTKGWTTYRMVAEAKKMHLGTDAFQVEYECHRPVVEGAIYNADFIEEAKTPLTTFPEFYEEHEMVVGIDWGLVTPNSMVMIPMVKRPEGVYVFQAYMTDHELLGELVMTLKKWQDRMGQFAIMADGSHAFECAQVQAEGFRLEPVHFVKYKQIGVGNVQKYLTFKRVFIQEEGNALLFEQLKAYKRGPSGAILKKNDHGPDALMAGLLRWRFEDFFADDLADADQKSSSKKEKGSDEGKDRKSEFSDTGDVVLI